MFSYNTQNVKLKWNVKVPIWNVFIVKNNMFVAEKENYIVLLEICYSFVCLLCTVCVPYTI